MKKSIIISSIVAFIMLSLAFSPQEEPHYKNLKVLPKHITKEQLDSTMKHFAKSLGVKCNFCHAPTADGQHLDFASDSIEAKGVARYMYKMMNKINKKSFKNNMKDNVRVNAVTCYTCHNGQKEPSVKPPPNPDDNK